MPPVKKKRQGCKKQTSGLRPKQEVKNKKTKDLQAQKAENKVTKVTCHKCKVQFIDMDALRSHQKEVHPIIYQCTLCDCTYTVRRHYRIHQMWHSGEKVYQCGVCSKYYESIAHLAKHQEVHTLQNKHLCLVCGRKFCRRSSLISHVNLHFGTLREGLNCNLCGKTCPSACHKEIHMQRHKRDRVGKYECSICDKLFLNISAQRRHRLDHIQASSEVDFETLTSYKCLFCEASLKLSKLKAHLQLHIGGLIQCRECEEIFSSGVLFKIHLKKHKQDSENKMYSVAENISKDM